MKNVVKVLFFALICYGAAIGQVVVDDNSTTVVAESIESESADTSVDESLVDGDEFVEYEDCEDCDLEEADAEEVATDSAEQSLEAEQSIAADATAEQSDETDAAAEQLAEAEASAEQSIEAEASAANEVPAEQTVASEPFQQVATIEEHQGYDDAQFVEFRQNIKKIEASYGSNSANLELLDDVFSGLKGNDDIEITEVQIVGYASPEGSRAVNNYVSKQRATALKNYLKKKFGFKDAVFALSNVVETYPKSVDKRDKQLLAKLRRAEYKVIFRERQSDVAVAKSPSEKELVAGIAETFVTNEESQQTSDASVYGAENFVKFQKGRAKIDLAFAQNSESLELINTIFAEFSTEAIAEVRIIGYASPDGPRTVNDRLSKQRALALKDYLKKKFNLNDSLFALSSVVESWDNLPSKTKKKSLTQYRKVEYKIRLHQEPSELTDNTVE